MQKQKKILVVEDEKILRDAIVDVFRPSHYDILEAKNGKEGVELALSNHPDLILLDLIMPEMDGNTALKKIRQDAWGQSVPVIILTNVTANNEKLLDEMMVHKPINYLIKSNWKLRDVVQRVEEILGT